MKKVKTTIYISQVNRDLARVYRLNISEICEDSIESMIKAKAGDLDADIGTIRKLAEDMQTRKKAFAEHHRKIQAEIQRENEEMCAHAKAAKAAGKTRGEAEFDFGKMFPDRIWNEA
jgi:hypothetical protein